jgi:transcriptional regulator with XRE-family HTH domain
VSRIKGKPNQPTTGSHWGASLAARRVAMNMTQATFAQRLGVNVRTVQSWEAGRRTSMYTQLVDDEVWRIEQEEKERIAEEAEAEAEAVA